MAGHHENGCFEPGRPGAIWITGAGGLIGHDLVLAAPAEARPALVPLTRTRLDLTDASAVRSALQRDRPRLVFHCAALSRSPACQADPAGARRINVEATARLAEGAANSALFLLSTDLVFDGSQGCYTEDNEVNPLSIYAETKVEAERIVLANPGHTVIRTSLNGGRSPTGDRGFNEDMRLAWQAGRTLDLFVDEFRCPIAAEVTARALWELALGQTAGLFHLAGSERLSRWELGEALAARWPQLHPRIRPGTLRDYRGAPRAPDTSLNCAKVQAHLSFPLPGIRAWLRDHPEADF